MPEIPKKTALAPAIIALLLSPILVLARQPASPPAAEPVPAVGAPAGVDELTRGPVHEAFGRPVVFDPQPGPIAPRDPPAPVEEVPPDERPTGDNVAWIPGYWAWEDDQNQFVWVSGFWRELPPGRTWVPGYWTHTDQGVQWVSGYWAPVGTADTPADVEYLPEPPASLEAGPPGAAPSADQIWIPGMWVWQTNRYAWRPGFWAAGSPDWVWMPASYQWSPLGYAYIPGYWDYPLWRRGLLFAPVTFTALRPGLVFTPRLALNTAYLGYSLFARPLTGDYYFGDYYANNYLRAGYYPWFSFHNTRYGYDPLFAHADWVYARQNIDWESRLRQVYYTRRDQPAARPARLYRDYVRSPADRGDAALVRPLAEIRTARDLPFKLQRVEPARAQQAIQHARAVRDVGTRRAQIEAARLKEVGAAAAKAPVKVRLPEAPRFAGAAVSPQGPKGLPEHPAHPQPDLTRKPEPRVPFSEARPPQLQPKIEARPPQQQPPPKIESRPPQPQPPPKIESRPPQQQPPPKIESRPPQPQVQPKIEARPPQQQPPPRAPGALPHPEDVLRPDFNRRAGHAPPAAPPAHVSPPPAAPPVRPPAPASPPPAAPPARPPAPPVHVSPPPAHPAPPAVHPAPPPITGAPHPGHVPPPKGK